MKIDFFNLLFMSLVFSLESKFKGLNFIGEKFCEFLPNDDYFISIFFLPITGVKVLD